MPLRRSHAHIIMHKHPAPGDFDGFEIKDTVVLVVSRGERVVEGRDGRRFKRLSRKQLHAFGVQRDYGGDAVLLFARLQGLNGRNHHLVCHRAAGGQHLRALQGDAVTVLIGNTSGDEFSRLVSDSFAAVRLRADDGIRQVEVIVASVLIVVRERPSISLAMVAEEIEPHVHTRKHRRNMVRRAAEEAAGQGGPCLKSGTPL